MNRPVLHLKRQYRSKTIPLTHQERECVYSCMGHVWQYVGYAAETACQYGAERLTRMAAAETILGAKLLERDAIERRDLRALAALAKFRTMTWRRQVRFLLNRYTLA